MLFLYQYFVLVVYFLWITAIPPIPIVRLREVVGLGEGMVRESLWGKIEGRQGAFYISQAGFGPINRLDVNQLRGSQSGPLAQWLKPALSVSRAAESVA